MSDHLINIMYTEDRILINAIKYNKVAIYVRVSTKEQALEGYSIGMQQKKLIQYCEINDWEIAGLYIDEGFSAKDLNRPQMKILLEDIKENKIGLILTYKFVKWTVSGLVV